MTHLHILDKPTGSDPFSANLTWARLLSESKPAKIH